MMHAIRLGMVALVIFATVCSSSTVAEEKGFAVVELFTSEGCSSCPPADGLLAKLAADAKKSGRAVYCLSFHVDYWDKLGWKDPFANPGNTQRQRDYVRSLKLRGLYTPQMVVNGTDEFVGSERVRAVKAIETSLNGKASLLMDVKTSATDQEIAVEYSIENAPSGAVFNVAWAEAEVTSNPDKGENAGEKLRHVNVVRDFQMVELKTPFSGRISLKRMNVKSGRVIAFVQEGKVGRVVGAAAVNPGMAQ